MNGKEQTRGGGKSAPVLISDSKRFRRGDIFDRACVCGHAHPADRQWRCDICSTPKKSQNALTGNGKCWCERCKALTASHRWARPHG